MQRMLPPTVGLKCGGASFSGPRPVTCSRAVGVAWQRLPRALSTGPRPRHNRAKHTPRRPKEPQARGSVQIPGSGIRNPVPFWRRREAGSLRPRAGTPRHRVVIDRRSRSTDPILSILTRFYRLKGQAHAFFKAVMPPPVAHLCDGGGLCDSWAPAPPMFPP